MSLSTNFSTSHHSDADNAVRKKDIGSPDKKTSGGSPSKKHRSQPVIRTPEKTKNSLPELQLHKLQQSDEAVIDSFKSPVGTFSFSARSVKSPSAVNESPRSVRSPKSPGSPRNEHETMSSRRHRIDSPRANYSIQQQTSVIASSQTTTQTVTSTFSASNATDTVRGKINTPTSPTSDSSLNTVSRQRMSSPPNTISLNQQTPEQMNALADLWIQHLLGSLANNSSNQVSLLTAAKISSLGRTDGKIAPELLPQALSDLQKTKDAQGKVALSGLLNSMLANHLSQSDAGKTIITMQVTVMHANPKLAAISFDDMIKMNDHNESAKIRQQMANAVTDQVNACIDVALGSTRKLSDSHLPRALLDFWRLLDSRLVKEAAKNPALTPEQILTARKNLGIDLLSTRQLHPFALKPTQVLVGGEVKTTRVTSDTALPPLATTFANKMSEAFLAAWPAFFADAIAHFDA
jgi:hypothetical protein